MARVLIVVIVLLSGCSLIPIDEVPTSVVVRIPSATPHPTGMIPSTNSSEPFVTPYPGDLQDMLPILSGICFEAAWDAAGQVFILRNADDHIRFYDLADNSGLCRRPVTRHPFDFTQGEVLAGLWSRGYGCVARYDIFDYARDDEAKTARIVLDFVTEGHCPYELVRGFWVSIPNAQDYTIDIQVRE